MFDVLRQQPADALLQLIGLFRADPRPDKLDLGVGVYRDAEGRTAVMNSVKAAERQLLETQATKAYLGPEGDARFVQLIGEVAFGRGLMATERLFGVQTPGGSGALRLGAELIGLAKPGARVWVGTPTWPNHAPILAAAGLEVATYAYFDPATQSVRFDEMMSALGQAAPGDVVLLHACCHNPTGADLTMDQWRAVTALVVERELFPLVDLAYQGLGHGLDADAEGVRHLLATTGEALVAYSCDKNFGVYRDRVGALFGQARRQEDTDRIFGNMLTLARVNWSMPPDHGAAAVRIVLDDPALRAAWQAELTAMCARLRTVRDAFARETGPLAAASTGNGMFAMLPLTKAQVLKLRSDQGIYMADSGRINVAGLTVEGVGKLGRALADLGRTELAA